jgi:hypothetical protein
MILPRFPFDTDVREYRPGSQNAAPKVMGGVILIEATTVPDTGRGGVGLWIIKASEITVFPRPIYSAIILDNTPLASTGFVTVSSSKVGLK